MLGDVTVYSVASKSRTCEKISEQMRTFCQGLLTYALGTVVVVSAVVYTYQGYDWCKPAVRPHPQLVPTDLSDCFATWDGRYYRQIVAKGYKYTPGESESSVRFFPAYPLLGRALGQVLGLAPGWALLVCAHLSLLSASILFAVYLKQRHIRGPTPFARQEALPAAHWFILLAFSLFPATFFFRMAYSESLLLFVSILVLYGLQHEWPWITIALIAGLATAVRPVGIGLVIPVLINLWQRSTTLWNFFGKAMLLAPLCCWGLLAFMLYQWQSFGDPLAFARAHGELTHFHQATWSEKSLALVTLKPIWSIFVPSSECYWKSNEPHNPLFSLYVANPIIFASTAGLILLGFYKRWCNLSETAFGLAMLLIPYLSRSYEMCMASGARFAIVAFPVYIVMGHLLSRLPRLVVILLLLTCVCLMAVYSARFALWYLWSY